MARRARVAGRTLIQKSRALSPQQKAVYHNIVGAGRSRVKREFFDLSDEDSETVVEFLERRLLAAEGGEGSR